jgi:hypothetical protein
MVFKQKKMFEGYTTSPVGQSTRIANKTQAFF